MPTFPHATGSPRSLSADLVCLEETVEAWWPLAENTSNSAVGKNGRYNFWFSIQSLIVSLKVDVMWCWGGALTTTRVFNWLIRDCVYVQGETLTGLFRCHEIVTSMRRAYSDFQMTSLSLSSSPHMQRSPFRTNVSEPIDCRSKPYEISM